MKTTKSVITIYYSRRTLSTVEIYSSLSPVYVKWDSSKASHCFHHWGAFYLARFRVFKHRKAIIKRADT